MPTLSCFRVVAQLDGVPIRDFDDVVDFGEMRVATHGPIEGVGYAAQLYVVASVPHNARWASFLRQGFGDELNLPLASSPAALLVVRVRIRRQTVMFAFPFGTAGRFLLRAGVYERGYGLKTALNIIYQRGDSLGVPRLRAVDSKRRGATTIRSRSQVSEASTFETFDVNRLRDVVSAATGVPMDEVQWGRHITGSDALSVGLELDFARIGKLCKHIEAAHTRDDYTDNFDWIDFIRPVTDPSLKTALEAEVLNRLRNSDGAGLNLAPPEILDWEHVSTFHYHFDPGRRRGRSAVTHPDLRVEDYVRGLRREGELDALDVQYLRSRRISALEGGGEPVHRWPVWRCLVGEFALDGETYILDEGDFFSVRSDYLAELDHFVDQIPESDLVLPPTDRTTCEGEYNESVAQSSASIVLLDRRTVTVPGRTTPIEVCDLVTQDRRLVHVKRHLSSSTLSHLFAQGLVSAELLQMNAVFRKQAHMCLHREAGGRPGFDFFDASAIAPRDFEVVYAIIADWHGRTMSQALPFFSKVNLREVANNLRCRDYRVATKRVATTP